MRLKFLSLNIKGLNRTLRQKALKKEADQSKADIIFAQETHLTDKDPCSFKMSKFPNIILANAPSKKRGVFIAIHDTNSFQQLQTLMDPAGCYIILVCLLGNKPFTLVKVYAPKMG